MITSRVLEERIATYDGEKFYNVITDDKIVITKSDKVSSFIKTNKDSFLQLYSRKAYVSRKRRVL